MLNLGVGCIVKAGNGYSILHIFVYSPRKSNRVAMILLRSVVYDSRKSRPQRPMYRKARRLDYFSGTYVRFERTHVDIIIII